MSLEEKLYTSAEVSQRYHVTEASVWRWIRNGWMSALVLGSGQERRNSYLIRESDLMAFEKARLKRATNLGGGAR